MAGEEDVASSLTSNLPGEIALNVLARLPIKSLMRFRCVNRSWNSIVKNPFFIKIHTSHRNLYTKLQDDSFLLIARHQRCKYNHDHMTSELSLISSKSKSWEPTTRIFHEEDEYDIVGSSNGLVCLLTYNPLERNSFMLLNPATREVKFTNVKLAADRFLLDSESDIAVGFGFNQEHKDFKIVLIAEEIGQREGEGSYKSEALVYSLNADSWKKVDKSNQLHMAIQRQDCEGYTSAKVELHNHLHWRVYNANEANWVMARFDLGTELFDNIALPKPFEIPNIIRWRQGERVAVVYHDYLSNSFEVWTMVGYEDASSWMKELTFLCPDGLDVAIVHCSLGNGDFIFSSRRENQRPHLYLASNKNYEVKDLGASIPEGTYASSYEVVIYKESLVRVNGDQTLIKGTASRIGLRKRIHRFADKLGILIFHYPFKVLGCFITFHWICCFTSALLEESMPVITYMLRALVIMFMGLIGVMYIIYDMLRRYNF